MSFRMYNETWQPKTAEEHADDLLESINTLLQQEGITDQEGNIAQLQKNYGNAMYLVILALANRLADNDAKLSAAINSLNVALCDDEQIENLLPIAAIDRNPGSYSTLQLSVTAETTGPCAIPAGTRAPFNNVYFVTKTDVVILAGQTQLIDTVCDTLGPVAVLSGEVTSFETSIPNLASVINPVSSIPGTSPETTNQLRQRIVKGNTIKYTLSGCQLALEDLTGVNYARIYFNFNTDEDIVLPGNITVPPRHAYIIIDGSSEDIANTYVEYMNAPTFNAEEGDRAHSQNYVSTSGQIVPVMYDDAREQNIYVKIFLENGADEGASVENQLKRDLITSSASWGIGHDVNALLVSKPFVNINYTKVSYCQVSLDGEAWSNNIEIDCNIIPRVTDATIEVETLE